MNCKLCKWERTKALPSVDPKNLKKILKSCRSIAYVPLKESQLDIRQQTINIFMKQQRVFCPQQPLPPKK